MARPADHDARLADDPAPLLLARFPDGTDLGAELLALLGSPTIADKSWVWRQYDHQLFLNTVVGPGADATVLRLKGTGRAIALSTDGKARFCRLEPRTGGRLVVLEAARNVACAGADPRALVNCLNFGNPEHPEVMWQFAEVVDGMSEACRALQIPVIGGNVSFYNESQGHDIDPTPVVGVIGLIDSLDRPPPGPRFAPGHHVVTLGATALELGGSEWAAVVHGLGDGAPPVADLDLAARAHGLVRDLVASRLVTAVHDASDGGWAVALAEAAIVGGCGFAVAAEPGIPAAAWCFAESASRVLVAVTPQRLSEVLTRAADAGVPARDVGMTGGARLIVDGVLDLALADADTRLARRDPRSRRWRRARRRVGPGRAAPNACVVRGAGDSGGRWGLRRVGRIVRRESLPLEVRHDLGDRRRGVAVVGRDAEIGRVRLLVAVVVLARPRRAELGRDVEIDLARAGGARREVAHGPLATVRASSRGR